MFGIFFYIVWFAVALYNFNNPETFASFLPKIVTVPKNKPLLALVSLALPALLFVSGLAWAVNKFINKKP